MTNKKRIQLYVDETSDAEVYALIANLEKGAKGKRGFVQEQIKERLKIFKKMQDILGSDNPLDVALAFQGNGLEKREAQSNNQPKSNKLSVFVNGENEDWGF